MIGKGGTFDSFDGPFLANFRRKRAALKEKISHAISQPAC
jgi:hypothetical protein